MKIQKSKVAMIVMIFLTVVSCSSSTEIDKGKFIKLNGAALAVRASIAGGASYQQLMERVQKLSTEIQALQGNATSREEKDILKAYSDLLAMYQDGLLLWKYKLEFAPFDFVPKGRIYVGQDIEPIVFKYRFSTESHLYQPTGQRWRSLPEDSTRIIWSNADAQLKIIENMTNYR